MVADRIYSVLIRWQDCEFIDTVSRNLNRYLCEFVFKNQSKINTGQTKSVHYIKINNRY